LGNWCGTLTTPSTMSPAKQATIINEKSSVSSRKAFHTLLKEKVPAKILETIPADPEGRNIPKDIANLIALGSPTTALAVPQSNYACVTQETLPITASASSDPLGIWIGAGNIIPRWKKGQVVQFVALAGGYPTPAHAYFAAYKLNEAAIQWNSLNIGVTFKWVSNLQDAAFQLAYGGDLGSVLARAFFPNANDLNTLFVYQKAFEPAISPYQTNIFLHELGHVLGLRHEFAVQEGWGAVPFGQANPRSVMSYVFPPNIRDSDEDNVKSFYDFVDPTFAKVKIVDWIPDN